MPSSLDRVRRLDDAADRLARGPAKSALILVAVLVTLVVVTPLIMLVPGAMLEAIIHGAMDANASGADPYELDVQLSPGEPPPGCTPEQTSAFRVPGSGTVYVAPKEGC